MAYVVTDLTLMSGGNACLACLDEEQLSCVRPLFDPALYRQASWYEENGICQGTKLDLTLSDRPSPPPHSEDFTCSEIRILGQLNDIEMQEILEESCYTTIAEGFGVSPVAGEKHFHHDGELPSHSIITLHVSPKDVSLHQDTYNPGRIKATIADDNGFSLSWIPVTDLRYINMPDDTFRELIRSVRRADKVYMRLGLTRCYCSPQNQNGYWLQANGLYVYR